MEEPPVGANKAQLPMTVIFQSQANSLLALHLLLF